MRVEGRGTGATVERWRLKQLWMRPFTWSKIGEDTYEWLTAAALGTQAGMSRKWCYWFREHLVLSRRFARISVSSARIWLFQPGWSLAPVVMSRMATGRGPLITEDRGRLARRYVRSALTQAAEAAPAVFRSAGGGEADPGLLERLRDRGSPQEILRICEAEYRVCDIAGLEDLPSASADLCISMGRLEHYAEDDLLRLLSEQRRILRPGGVASHIVDHRDHFLHYDRGIHCFHHLTYSDEDWATIARGRKLFRNRLLESDYTELFERSGFRVLGCVHRLHQDDASGVDPQTLWGRYREMAAGDLTAAVSHFVVRRE